jgi:SWI/SNF-related matrix-associated actin-dependent regulator 1 of chromatin subfamily A
MLKALQWFLTQLGLEIIYIDGSVSKAARDELVQRFQDPEAGVHAAVLSIGACNSGINLFRANQVVFAELVFDGCQILQAKDRVHRIGQTSPVTVHFMTIDKSGDDLLWRAVLKHIGVMSKIVDHASNRAVNYGIPSTQLPECDPNQDAVAKAIQAAWSAQNQTETNDQPSGLPNLDLTLQTS